MTVALRVDDPIIYSPIASPGHYRGVVRAVRSPEMVDIELLKDDSGPGDAVQLRCIAVVGSLKDLTPGTCTASPA